MIAGHVLSAISNSNDCRAIRAIIGSYGATSTCPWSQMSRSGCDIPAEIFRHVSPSGRLGISHGAQESPICKHRRETHPSPMDSPLVRELLLLAGSSHRRIQQETFFPPRCRHAGIAGAIYYTPRRFLRRGTSRRAGSTTATTILIAAVAIICP